MSEKEQRRNLTPQEVVLNAFTYFNAKQRGIDEESLIRICLTANCPTKEIAKRVLANMVAAGDLIQEKNGESIIYKLANT